MTTLELAIDAGAARHGAREFARGAADIVESARAAKLAVDGVRESFMGLRESLFSIKFDGNRPIARRSISALLDTGAFGPSSLAARDNLLVLAVSSERDVNRVTEDALLHPPNEFQTAADDVADFLEKIDFIPRVDIVAKGLRALIEIVESTKVRTPEETFGLINEFNRPIPALREIVSQQTGRTKKVISSVVEALDSSSDQLFEEFKGEFNRKRANLFGLLNSQGLINRKDFVGGLNVPNSWS